MKGIIAFAVIGMSLVATCFAAQPEIFIDAGPSNTVRVLEPEEPFSTTLNNPIDLWQTEETGFDVHETRIAYLRRFGDAPMLKTTATGLEPGKTYGVYVCFIGSPKDSQRIWAGLEKGKLDLFTSTEPKDRITDLGGTKKKRTQHQYLGLIGDAKAGADGTLAVYIDDAQGSSNKQGTIYEGIALGAPTGKTAPGKISITEKKVHYTIRPHEDFTTWGKRDASNPKPRQKRPNILWITCEDISPYLNCYGYEQAITPNLDKDIGEQYNLIEKNPEMTQHMRDMLTKILTADAIRDFK